MNLIVLFLAANMMLNVVFLPGTPFYVNGTDSCYYNGTAIDNDSLFEVTQGNETIVNASTIRDEAQYPTNQTWNGTIFEGAGNVFNSFTDAGEQLYKYGEIMRGIVLGGFIEDVIDNVVLNCYFDTDGRLAQGADHAFWTNMKSGISGIILFLLVLTVWYHISGRGHLLSS